MSDFEKDPLLIGEILREHGVILEDGTVNKLGVIALFTGREISEIDPLEAEPHEELARLVKDRNTSQDVLERIIIISRRRNREPGSPGQTGSEAQTDSTDLHSLDDQALIDLLSRKDTPDEVIQEIARIAQERREKRSLPPGGD